MPELTGTTGTPYIGTDLENWNPPRFKVRTNPVELADRSECFPKMAPSILACSARTSMALWTSVLGAVGSVARFSRKKYGPSET